MWAAGLPMAKMKLVGVNEHGLRVGQDHQRAKLTDHEVEMMRKLHEDDGVGYRRLSKMFEVGKTTVRNICGYKVRVQTAVTFRKV